LKLDTYKLNSINGTRHILSFNFILFIIII
jgi:hypothetical protein